MSGDANTEFAHTIVDEWVRAGVRDACVSPGSRNAPLTLALVEDGRMRVHVHLDERSAGFFALGCARATGRPAVVCCTSGTAAAHLHPAVLEASHGRVPLLVCTADRPPELRDSGAGQTIDQHRLYGGVVRWFCDVEAPTDHPGIGSWWRSLAARAAASALGPPAGPVHLNLAFREPLAPTGAPLAVVPGRADGLPWTNTSTARRILDAPIIERLAGVARETRRGLVVAGWGADVSVPVAMRFARCTGWPLLADPLSGLRTGDAISAYDALVRHRTFADDHRPDLVLRLGAPPTSAAVASWLATAPHQWLVDPDDRWLEPAHTATERLVTDPDAVLEFLSDRLGATPGPAPWLEDWRDADRKAQRAIDEELERSEEPFEGRIARDVVAALPEGSTLVVASSMPVRDVETFAQPRAGLRILANRGVNGIDGFVSTTLGVAAASDGPVVALTGDLCFLHDASALLGAPQRGLDATFVVVDNDGGGIFSFLPYADVVDPEQFERVLATPPHADLADVAAGYQVPVLEVEKASALIPALDEARADGGVRIVRVRTDRRVNVTRHRDVWASVVAAL